MTGGGATEETPETAFELRPTFSIGAYLAAAAAGAVTGTLTFFLMALERVIATTSADASLADIMGEIYSEFVSIESVEIFSSWIGILFASSLATIFPFVFLMAWIFRILNFNGRIMFSIAAAICVYSVFLLLTIAADGFAPYYMPGNIMIASFSVPAGIVAGLTYRAVLLRQQMRRGKRHAPQS